MKYKNLKLLTCILIVLLLVNSVSAAIGALAMTLGQNYALQIVAQNIDPMAMKAISFAIDPRSAATSEVMGYVGQISPELAKGLNIAQNPGAAAKQEILQRTLTEVAKKDPKTAMILANSLQISEYAKVAFQPDPQSKEPLAQAEYDPKTGMMTIKRNGQEFAKVPSGYEIKNEKGILTFANKEGTNEPLQIGTYKITAQKNANIQYSEAGDGSSTLKLSEGNVIIGKTWLNNLKEATIKVDKNKQIEFAEFDSTKAQAYSLEYNKKSYSFKTTKENSHIKFDPKNRVIYGENLDLDYQKSKISGTVTINLDEKGDFSRIEFKANGVFKDEETGITATSKKDFDVCLNKDITCSRKDTAFSFENKEGGLVLRSRGEISYRVKNTQIDAFEQSETRMVVEETYNVLKVEKGSAKFKKDTVEGIITREAGKTKVTISPESITNPKKLTEALIIKDTEEYAVTPKGNFVVEGKKLVNSFDEEELQFLGFAATPVVPIAATKSDTQLNIINQRIARNNAELKKITPKSGVIAALSQEYEAVRPSNLYGKAKKVLGFGGEGGYQEKTLKEMDRLNEENNQLLAIKKELERGVSYDEALKNLETRYKIDKTDPTLTLLNSVNEDGSIKETGILEAANRFKAKEGEGIAYFSAVEGYKETVKDKIVIDKTGKNLGSFNSLPDGSESITSLLDTHGLLGEKIEVDKASVMKQLQREELPRLQTTQTNLLDNKAIISSADLKKLLIDLENPTNYYVARNGELITYATHGEQIKEEIKRLDSIERANPELFRSLTQNYNSAYTSKYLNGAVELVKTVADDPAIFTWGAGKAATFVTKGAGYIASAEIAASVRAGTRDAYLSLRGTYKGSIFASQVGAVGLDITPLIKAERLINAEVGGSKILSKTLEKAKQYGPDILNPNLVDNFYRDAADISLDFYSKSANAEWLSDAVRNRLTAARLNPQRAEQILKEGIKEIDELPTYVETIDDINGAKKVLTEELSAIKKGVVAAEVKPIQLGSRIDTLKQSGFSLQTRKNVLTFSKEGVKEEKILAEWVNDNKRIYQTKDSFIYTNGRGYDTLSGSSGEIVKKVNSMGGKAAQYPGNKNIIIVDGTYFHVDPNKEWIVRKLTDKEIKGLI